MDAKAMHDSLGQGHNRLGMRILLLWVITC